MDKREKPITGTSEAERPSAAWISVFEKIAAMLSEKWGVRVAMRGSDAYTDGKLIVLPVMPDNAPADFLAAEHGVLDHETGHVIDSEFFAIADPLEKHLVNALEDARIEMRMIDRWPGTAANLRACTDFFCRQLDEKGWPVSDFHKFCTALYFHERYPGGHWFADEWIPRSAEIHPHLEAAVEILARRPMRRCEDTRQVWDIAREILGAVKDLARPAPPEPEPERGVGGGTAEDSAGDPSSASAEAGGVADAAGASADPTGRGMPQEAPAPRPASASPSAPDTGTEATAPASPGTRVDDDRDPEAPVGRGTPGSALEPGMSATENPKDITAVTLAELRRDAEWTVQRFLSERARALHASTDAYLVYTTEKDVVEHAPAGDRALYQKSIHEAQSDVAAIKRTLARTLLASRKARWERSQPRGKVDPAALYKIPVGADRHLFRRRELAQAFNTRVCLLVDHSGSMMGGRIQLAARGAAVFAEVLHQLRIPFEILGFTSGPHGDGRRHYLSAKEADRRTFSRWGYLRTLVYKEYAEDFRRVCGRLWSMFLFSGGEANYDGDSLLLASRRLADAARPGERRILFVFSDGCPAGTVTEGQCWERQGRHLHDAVRQIRAAGTELFGIGIESDAVREYFPLSTVVDNTTSLERAVIGSLGKMLLQSGRSVRSGQRIITGRAGRR